MRAACSALVLLSALACNAGAQLVTNLSPATAQAFEQYVVSAEGGITGAARTERPLPLLAGDAPQRAKRGEFVLRGITPTNGQEIPGGLIHDWVGGVFIPGATLDRTVAALQDFDAHKRWYPEIIDSRLMSRNGSDAVGRWVMLKKKIITVVLSTELDSRLTRVSPTHAFLVSKTKRITEVRDHGKPSRSEYPAGQGHGFLWGFNGYWTVHEADGGVYAECRVISYSRDVPAGLGWIVNPFVRSMPRESLESTLLNTKKALSK